MPLARSYLLEILSVPKIVLPAGDQTFNMMSLLGTFYIETITSASFCLEDGNFGSVFDPDIAVFSNSKCIELYGFQSTFPRTVSSGS